MSKAVLVLALLVSSALLAACGGGSSAALSKEEYGQTVAQAGDSLGQAFEELATKSDEVSQSDVSSGDDLNTMMDTLSSALDDAAGTVNAKADELAGLTPPEDAQAANDKLVTGLRALADKIEELQNAVENGELANILDLANGFKDISTSEAGAEIQSAIDELKAKGYDVEGTG